MVPVRSRRCAAPPIWPCSARGSGRSIPRGRGRLRSRSRGGTIVAVGDDAEVREACDAATETIDGRGLALVPGLVDSHQHPLMGADDTVGADLAGLATLDELRSALAAEHARCGAGQWVRGHSLDYATFDGLELDGALVEDAVGGAPALLTFFDFHTALATPAALAAAGIDGPRPLEGSAEIVCRDGRPTGALLEPAAYRLVERVMPQPTAEARRERRAEALRRMAAAGLTAVHAMDGSPATHDELRELEARGELCVRIVAPLLVEPTAPGRSSSAGRRCATSTASAGARGVAKFFIDGVVETGTAWLEQPDTAGLGLEPLWPDPERYARAVALFARAGFQCADARGRRPGGALRARRLPRGRSGAGRAPPGGAHRDARRRAARALRGRGRRGVHAGAPSAVDARRRLGPLVARARPRARGPGLPLRRSRGQWRPPRARLRLACGALRSASRAWPGRACGGRRATPGARPSGRRRRSRPSRPWGLYERGRRAVGEDAHAGRIAVGLRADLTGFASDPVECPADELPDLPVLLTVVAGEPVMQR